MDRVAEPPGGPTTALADRYRLERELGADGMATVYLAEDLKHHRQVAIKGLKPELAAALGPGRFLREVETTAGVRHPHILPLFDSGQVDGESLRDRLAREKQLPIADALGIAREVAKALAAAHAQGRAADAIEHYSCLEDLWRDCDAAVVPRRDEIQKRMETA